MDGKFDLSELAKGGTVCPENLYEQIHIIGATTDSPWYLHSTDQSKFIEY